MRSELGRSFGEVVRPPRSPKSQEVGQSEPPGPPQYLAPSEPAEQSQLVELAVVGAHDHALVPPEHGVVFWPVTPRGPAKGAGPGAGEARLQASQPVLPSCVQSPDRGAACEPCSVRGNGPQVSGAQAPRSRAPREF